MINKSKLFLVAAVAAIGISSPALADYVVADSLISTTPAVTFNTQVTPLASASRADGAYAYALAQGKHDASSAAMNGAGSAGYNWALGQF